MAVTWMCGRVSLVVAAKHKHLLPVFWAMAVQWLHWLLQVLDQDLFSSVVFVLVASLIKLR